MENGSLLSTLKAFGSLPEKLVASYTRKILSGLAYLHEHEVCTSDSSYAPQFRPYPGNALVHFFFLQSFVPALLFLLHHVFPMLLKCLLVFFRLRTVI